MPEWSNGVVSKTTDDFFIPGFESLSLLCPWGCPGKGIFLCKIVEIFERKMKKMKKNEKNEKKRNGPKKKTEKNEKKKKRKK